MRYTSHTCHDQCPYHCATLAISKAAYRIYVVPVNILCYRSEYCRQKSCNARKSQKSTSLTINDSNAVRWRVGREQVEADRRWFLRLSVVTSVSRTLASYQLYAVQRFLSFLVCLMTAVIIIIVIQEV